MAVPEVLNFEAPVHVRDTLPFRINGGARVLTAVKPKTAIMMDLVAGVDDANEAAMAGVVQSFIANVLDSTDGHDDDCGCEPDDDGDLPVDHLPSSLYVQRRLLDPDDEWDTETLVPVIEALSGRWFARPTGSPAGSSGRSRNAGRRSTGNSRS